MIETKIYKEKLEIEKSRIEKELNSMAVKGNGQEHVEWETKADVNAEEMVADPNEAADKIEEFETNSGLVGNLQIQLNEVNDALGKIEAGTYGVCEISGHEIEKDRLDANPSARTCIEHMNDK